MLCMQHSGTRTKRKTGSVRMPPTALPKPSPREIAPPEFSQVRYRFWPGEHQDERQILQSNLATWMQNLTTVGELFKQHVYENKDLRESDLRQHRIMLYNLLFDGESLALAYMEFWAQSGKPNDLPP